MDETKPAAASAPITVGSLFSDTFRAFNEGVATYLPLSILLHLPVILVAAAMVPDDVDSKRGLGWFYVNFLVSGLAGALLSAAIAYGVVLRLRSSKAGLGACLGAAFSRLFPLVGLAVLLFLILVVIMIPVGMLAFPFVLMTRGSALLGVIIVAVVGLVAVSMIMVRWFVASPAIVVERFGVAKSMQESTRLTAGYRGRIFVLVVLLGLVDVVLTQLLQHTVDGLRLQTFFSLAVKALLTAPLGACGAAVAYQRLKMAKDSVDVGSLEKVFE